MHKELGKIKEAYVGIGGYQNCMIGIYLTLAGKVWECGTQMGAWDANIITCDKHSKWTEADRSKQYDDIMRYISNLLYKAKVDRVEDLVGIPIEAEFDGTMFKSFRILEEVL